MKQITRRSAIAGAIGLAGTLSNASSASAMTPTSASREFEHIKIYSHTFGAFLKYATEDLEALLPGVVARTNDALERFGAATGIPPAMLDLSRELLHGYSGEWSVENKKKREAAEANLAKELSEERAEYQRRLAEVEAYQPTQGEIDNALQRDRDSSHQQFAQELETARAMLQKYPDLVTAAEFPQEHLEALRGFYGEEDREPSVHVSDDFMEPITPSDREHSIEFLRAQHRRRNEPQAPVVAYKLTFQPIGENAA